MTPEEFVALVGLNVKVVAPPDPVVDQTDEPPPPASGATDGDGNVTDGPEVEVNTVAEAFTEFRISVAVRTLYQSAETPPP